MSFFNRKSNNDPLRDFWKMAADCTGNQRDGSCKTIVTKVERRSCSVNPELDDNLPDDYLFNGWGGVDDEE